jgi:hypothetical protein
MLLQGCYLFVFIINALGCDGIAVKQIIGFGKPQLHTQHELLAVFVVTFTTRKIYGKSKKEL